MVKEPFAKTINPVHIYRKRKRRASELIHMGGLLRTNFQMLFFFLFVGAISRYVNRQSE